MSEDRLRSVRRSLLGERFPFAVAGLAVVAGLVVFWVATSVFPYHSFNHDEGVYLQQAMMLLEGQLFLNPPAADVFEPWFFVHSEQGLYPKYAPVTAVVFAPGVALGVPRLMLAVVGAAVVGLVALIGAELFDRPTGLLAGVVVLASPLFLIDAAVFLPYAPTTALNLTFAYAYLRGDRTGSRRWAALAGGAVGLAFFSRPYTAVLFALPFIAHALWTMRTRERSVVLRQGTTAALGLAGVALTLAYNAVVTGDPLLFPYEAFAPRDGLGFGHREILGYERNYTPELALEANTEVLTAYATEWIAAGVSGTVAAVVGLAVTLGFRRDARRLALAGVIPSVVLGELYFWGTLNILGPDNTAAAGLIANLGPYYHFDLLVPTAIFAAVGLLALGRTAWGAIDERLSRRRAAAVGVAVLAVTAPLAASTAVSTASEPIEHNADITDHYAEAYEPFEETDLSNAVVTLPDIHGPWLNHPFQALRNDPGYDGETVYAMEGEPFAVADAFPDRRLFRYVYRGSWTPGVGAPVEPRLQPVDHERGRAVDLSTTVGVPEQAIMVTARLQSEEGRARYTISEPPSELDLELTFENGTVALTGESVTEAVSIPVEDRDLVSTTLFVDYGTGAAFSYEIDTPVRYDDGTTEALTPTLEYCRVAHRCNGRAAYLPEQTPEDVFIDVSLDGRDG
jgi:hypothetical protein